MQEVLWEAVQAGSSTTRQTLLHDKDGEADEQAGRVCTTWGLHVYTLGQTQGDDKASKQDGRLAEKKANGRRRKTIAGAVDYEKDCPTSCQNCSVASHNTTLEKRDFASRVLLV